MARRSNWQKKKREKLWKENEGKCCYCNILTVLPTEKNANFFPDNLATLDHLINKLEKNRKTPNRSNQNRVVLACRNCNHARGKFDEFRLMKNFLLKADKINYEN